jgi:hypothetical protein
VLAELLSALQAGGAFAADGGHGHVARRFSLRSRLAVIDLRFVDRFVDVASVVLISIAAVLTALCGYQSARWSGHQARDYNIANAERIASAESSDRANVLTAIDVGLFLQYIDAVAAGNTAKAQFVYQRLRPEMKPAMDAWIKAKPRLNPKAPSSPFVMPQYSLQTRAKARRLEASAQATFEQAQAANEHSDNFLLLTVIFAGVSVLGGMSTKMFFPRHLILVGLIGLIYGGIRLAELPFL